MLTASEFSKGFVFLGELKPDFPFKIRTAAPLDWRPILARRGLHDAEISADNTAMMEAGFAAYASYARRMLVGAAPNISDPADMVPETFSVNQGLFWCVGWSHHQKNLGDVLVALTEAAIVLDQVNQARSAPSSAAVEFTFGPASAGRPTWH